jgi:hypothetical protein
LSEESFYLGEIESGSYYGPQVISFFSDGRVLWREAIEPVFGTYTCSEGKFTASFPDRESSRVIAQLEPSTMVLTVDGRKFVPETDE